MTILFWIYLVEVLIVSVLTFFFEYRYLRKGTPFYIYLTVFVGWILGFIIIATLPLDIYTSSVYDEKASDDDDEFFRDFIQWNWKVLYIITFILNWIVFPYLMAYAVRGEFTRCRRIWKSLVFNMWSYLAYIIFVSAAIPIVYLLINKNRKDKNKIGIIDV